MNKSEGNAGDRPVMPPSYTYISIVIGMLKRIVVKKNDKVVVANDARNSWRKYFYPIYKAQRAEQRDKHVFIDWAEQFEDMDKKNAQLEAATDWLFLKLSDFITSKQLNETPEAKRFGIELDEDISYGVEADDIAAVCCKHFTDQEVIVISGDADLDQLVYFPNTKIFSTNIKYNNQKGCYKVIDNPLKIIADKVRKGDVSDNIIVDKENDTALEASKRKFIIDVLNLPSFIEDPIKEMISNFPNKKCDFSKLPFQNSLAKRFHQIYLPDKEITWDKAVKQHEKNVIAKKEKARASAAKRKTKKLKEKEESFR